MNVVDIGETPIISWLNDANKQEHSQKKYVKKKGASVIYPCFEEASRLYKSIDPFWSELLFSCAKGTFPRGFTYKVFPGETNVHIISTGRGAKKTEYTLPSDPGQLGQFCIELFRNSSILSEKDKDERAQVEKKLADSTVQIDDWVKVRSKTTKYKLIQEYISNTYRSYKPEQRNRIYIIMCSCLDQKKITKKNIKISGGRITDITGFHITESECVCLIEKCQAGARIKEHGREPIHQYYKNWVAERDKLFGISHKTSTTTKSTPFI